MSDEFMDGAGGGTENRYGQPQTYSEPEHDNRSFQEYSEPEHTGETTQSVNDSQQNYGQSQYDPNNFGSSDYRQMNYNQEDYSQYQNNYGQQNYNQAPYGQPYPGMAAKSDSTGFGIASLVLGIVSIFSFFCCINYILAIIAIVLGIVQIVKSSKKGLAIAGIITAGISIVGSIIFWILIGTAGFAGMESMPDYMEKYMQEDYMQEYLEENDAAL